MINKFRTWEDVINSNLVKKKTKEERIIDMSRSLRAIQRDKEDTDIKHLICRAIKVFDDSLFEITDKHGSQLNSLGRYSVSILRNICQFVQNVMTVEEKKD